MEIPHHKKARDRNHLLQETMTSQEKMMVYIYAILFSYEH